MKYLIICLLVIMTSGLHAQYQVTLDKNKNPVPACAVSQEYTPASLRADIDIQSTPQEIVQIVGWAPQAGDSNYQLPLGMQWDISSTPITGATTWQLTGTPTGDPTLPQYSSTAPYTFPASLVVLYTVNGTATTHSAWLQFDIVVHPSGTIVDYGGSGGNGSSSASSDGGGCVTSTSRSSAVPLIAAFVLFATQLRRRKPAK